MLGLLSKLNLQYCDVILEILGIKQVRPDTYCVIYKNGDGKFYVASARHDKYAEKNNFLLTDHAVLSNYVDALKCFQRIAIEYHTFK